MTHRNSIVHPVNFHNIMPCTVSGSFFSSLHRHYMMDRFNYVTCSPMVKSTPIREISGGLLYQPAALYTSVTLFFFSLSKNGLLSSAKNHIQGCNPDTFAEECYRKQIFFSHGNAPDSLSPTCGLRFVSSTCVKEHTLSRLPQLGLCNLASSFFPSNYFTDHVCAISLDSLCLT